MTFDDVDRVNILLIDSESPVTFQSDKFEAVRHRLQKDEKIEQKRLYLMVQCMETWFLADLDSLGTYYGYNLYSYKKDERLENIESIPVKKVKEILADISEKSEYSHRGVYCDIRKATDGFAILEKISPNLVMEKSPHFKELIDFLNSFKNQALTR